MALRVLLADESSTIKKVIQLALQDFAVDVKAVQLGIDVLEVARAFQPDIIFADVLLQKCNGYEVSSDVKKDGPLKNTPVVLMWSSFMELDERKFAECRADDRLEKPFDVEDLRGLILKHVPKAKDHRLAPYLVFSPTLTHEFKDDERQKSPAPTQPVEAASGLAMIPDPPTSSAPVPKSPPKTQPEPAAPAPAPTASEWNMDDFEDVEEFAQKLPEWRDPGSSDLNADDAWASRGLDEFKVPDPDEELEEEFQVADLSHKGPRVGENTVSQMTIQRPRPETVMSDEDGFSKIDPDAFFQHPLHDSDEEDEDFVPVGLEQESSQQTIARAQTSTSITPIPEDAPLPNLSLEEPEWAQHEVMAERLLEDPAIQAMIEVRVEKVVREKTRELVEQAVRKLLPELAANIIEKELERLSQEVLQED